MSDHRRPELRGPRHLSPLGRVAPIAAAPSGWSGRRERDPGERDEQAAAAPRP